MEYQEHIYNSISNAINNYTGGIFVIVNNNKELQVLNKEYCNVLIHLDAENLTNENFENGDIYSNQSFLTVNIFLNHSQLISNKNIRNVRNKNYFFQNRIERILENLSIADFEQVYSEFDRVWIRFNGFGVKKKIDSVIEEGGSVHIQAVVVYQKR